MTLHSSRFICPSSDLHLGRLIRKAWKVLAISMVVAIAIHLSLTRWRGLVIEQRTAKPLTTQFVKRQPRLTKPLELKKRPRPKRRTIRRKMVSVKAKVDRQRMSAQVSAPKIVQSLSRPSAMVGRSTFFSSVAMEPSVLAQAIESAKEAQNIIDTSLEMLSVEALDTGEYHAMVIQDPRDKRNIRGFFHVARAYPQTVGSIEATNPNNRGSPWALPRGIPGLIDALNKWTGIKADIRGTFTFDSRELFKTPMLFIASHVPFRLTEAEALTLGRYLLAGGFLYTDTLISVIQPLNYRSIVLLWKDGLAAVDLLNGRHWDFGRLAQGHAIYHCYYDFDRTPNGHDDCLWKCQGKKTFSMVDEPPAYLEGVTIDGRLLGICTAKNYTGAWDVWPNWPGIDNTRQLQLGINFIVFALTQEGSITQQVMCSVD